MVPCYETQSTEPAGALLVDLAQALEPSTDDLLSVKLIDAMLETSVRHRRTTMEDQYQSGAGASPFHSQSRRVWTKSDRSYCA